LTDAAPRILFVPVSGPYGMGEYARCAAIAAAVQRRWPAAAVQFVLSRAAPYAASAPFPTTLLATSATFQSAAVVRVLEAWRPQVVVFDNAGRTVQLRAAQGVGARVVYVSARRRQRAKAFRLRWMRVIDEHWIAYPEFIAGRLTAFERLKLRLLRRPTVRYLDVICSRPTPDRCAALMSHAGCSPGAYVLVVPGGGTGHPGADDAVEEFLAAARRLAAAGIPTVFVGPASPAAASLAAPGPAAPGQPAAGSAAPDAALDAKLRLTGALPQSDLAGFMSGARVVITNGGSTLLQAIAGGAACVAVPIARDQIGRIRHCVRAGVAIDAAPDAASIVEKASALLNDEQARTALAQRAAGLGLADGIEVAVGALDKLFEST
jgi:glycosyltransferase involved in cell wall biosynthesis